MERKCDNLLALKGRQFEIEQLVKQAIESGEVNGLEYTYDLAFDKLMPVPEDIRKRNKSESDKQLLRKKYGYDNLDAWCEAHWGVTDEAEDSCYHPETNTYTFVTWEKPPLRAVRELSRLYPTLEFILEYKNFEHDNENIITRGQLICRMGDVVTEETWKEQVSFCDHCGNILASRKIDEDTIRSLQ